MKSKTIIIVTIGVVLVVVIALIFFRKKKNKRVMNNRVNNQLTKNFTLEELTYNRWATEAEQKRTDAALAPTIISNLTELAINLQVLRDYYNKPIIVNIAFRPKWWELKQGRTGTSQHTLGKAADIRIKGVKPNEIKEAIDFLIDTGKMKQGGIGVYNSFLHYDIRGTKARWTN